MSKIVEGYVEFFKLKVWKLNFLRVSTKYALFEALFIIFYMIKCIHNMKYNAKWAKDR